jgi:hypothetical protein
VANYAQLAAAAAAAGALVLSIMTSCEQSDLSETQQRFEEEQTRLAQEQNAIAAEQQNLAARDAAPGAVDWAFAEVEGESDTNQLINLIVTNREKQAVYDAVLSLHVSQQEKSTIRWKYSFGLIEPCTKERISVNRAALFDEDGFTFTLTFKDFTGQYWYRGSGNISKAQKPEDTPSILERVNPTVQENVC